MGLSNAVPRVHGPEMVGSGLSPVEFRNDVAVFALCGLSEVVRPWALASQGGVGGDLGSDAFTVITDGGRFSAHGTPSGAFARIDGDAARRRGISVTTIADLQYLEGDRARLLPTILEELRLERVAPLLAQTFALADAEKAHLAIEARETVGKTLLVQG